jgi:hypothetical protein
LLPTFLDKLSGLLDRRFVEAHWAPVFLFFALLLLTAIMIYSPAEALDWWRTRDATSKATVAFGALFLVTVVAYLLSACSNVVASLYTGYWLKRLRRVPVVTFFKEWAEERQRALRAQRPASDRYEAYSREQKRVVATRLGNVLTAAYDYARHTYGVEGVVWWPRLTAVLPDAFRARVDSALTPLTALLNLCTLLVCWTLLSAVALLALDDRPWAFALFFVGGVLLAYAFYRAAVWQAAELGTLVRAAYDLYRHEILTQMHIPIPQGASAERTLWEGLNYWVQGDMPYDASKMKHPDFEQEEFLYDTKPPGRTRTEVAWGSLPVLTVSRRKEAEE